VTKVYVIEDFEFRGKAAFCPWGELRSIEDKGQFRQVRVVYEEGEPALMEIRLFHC